MDFLPLAIFPQGSLASSVITTVWIGVSVLVFFNLRLGWVLSGLVVPGYLVPLLLLKPWTAGIVFFEAMVTYGLVWLFSEYLSRWGYWSNFFGRDRFFALVLASIMVRLVFDGWFFPMIGATLEARWHLPFDYRNNLHSFGLIIVALMANQFWKTGFLSGLPPMLVTSGITYLIVRYLLMEWTNFNISSLGYLYEDVASSILASPKSYIILVITAFLSSRMNLHYGWDFNGILVPSLLALQWYQPAKIFTSFIETFFILLLVNLVLRLPFFKQTSMEGAYKLLLFFNMSYAYKMFLGYLAIWYLPQVKVTDLYGLGYLLPTLMAIKMHDKGIVARLTRSTLQTSLTAVAAACIIGLTLTRIPALWAWPTPAVVGPLVAVAHFPHARLMDVIRADKIALYKSRTPNRVSVPLAQEIDVFAEAIRTLLAYRAHPQPQGLQHAQMLLAQVNYRIDTVQERYLYLRENVPQRGWGLYVLDMQVPDGLLVEVPAPLDEQSVLEAGVSLFLTLSGSTLAIAGAPRQANADGSADVLHNPQTIFHTFHRETARANVLQVRAYTAESVRLLSGLRRQATAIELPQLRSSLWVRASLPAALDLVQLKTLLDDYRIDWAAPPLANLQYMVTRQGFAALFLNRADIRKVLFRPLLQQQQISLEARQQRIDGYLQEWLLHSKEFIATRGSNLYKVPALEELLFFDEEVLTPLLDVLQASASTGHLEKADWEEMRAVAGAAEIFGYRLIRYHHQGSGQDYIILAEQSARRRYGGTYIWRLGAANNYVLQVPRPLYEVYSFEYAVALFERLQARALLIGGTHPQANIDGSADLLKAPTSLFNLVHQVILREARDTPMLVVQSRAFRYQEELPLPEGDALMAFDNGATTPQALPPLGQQLYRTMEEDGLRVRFVSGSAATAGYETGQLLQLRYLNATTNKAFALLWLSPLARLSYRQQTENHWQQAQFTALAIPTVEADLYQYIINTRRWGTATKLPQRLRQQIRHYIETRDIVSLQALLRTWPQHRFERLFDLDSQQAFFLVYDPTQALTLVVNLSPRELHNAVKIAPDRVDRTVIGRFVDSRAMWLEFDGRS